LPIFLLKLFPKWPIIKGVNYGGGKLKLPAGALRAFTAALIASVFYLSTPGVPAQEEPASPVEETSEPVPETQAEAPDTTQAVTAAAEAIAAVEREFSLGEGGPANAGNPTSIWNILKVLLTLAVVAVAIYGMVFFIKRAVRGNTAKDPFLKILASTQLGVNRHAYVLSVGTQAWLVGSAETGVNLIAEIGDKDILNAMLLDESEKSARTPPGRFLDFKALLGKLGMKVETDAPGPDNIRKRSERLKGL
jgi:flagellar protein FliO/FliZ